MTLRDLTKAKIARGQRESLKTWNEFAHSTPVDLDEEERNSHKAFTKGLLFGLKLATNRHTRLVRKLILILKK